MHLQIYDNFIFKLMIFMSFYVFNLSLLTYWSHMEGGSNYEISREWIYNYTILKGV